jgi:hypothetical protein
MPGAERLMRSSLRALVAEPGMEFFNDKDKAIFDRADGSAPEWAKRPVFLTDASSDYALLLHHFWRPGTSYHYLALAPDSDVPDVEFASEWKRLIGHMKRLLPVLRPTRALAFAQARSADADPVDYGRICSDRDPVLLLPWNAFDPEYLAEETHGALTRAAGVAVSRLDDGQLIVEVATPGHQPDPTFVSMIGASEGIAYVDPMLDGS